MTRTRLLPPLLVLVLAVCGVGTTGGSGEERHTPARASSPSAAATTEAPGSPPSSAPTPTGPEPTSCPNGKLIPAVDSPAVHAEKVVIPEAKIGGATIPAVTIPGVDIPAVHIPAQCTEIAPAPGGCLGAASIPPVSIPAVEIPPAEIPGVNAGGIKLDPVRADRTRAEAVHAEGVSTPEVCQVEPQGGGIVPLVIRPHIIRPLIIRPLVIRPLIIRPSACNEQNECIPAAEVPAVEVPAIEVPAVEIPAAELKAYEIGKSEVLEGDGSIAFSITTDVLFDFDSATIKPAAAAELRRIARQIEGRAEARATINVEGHTDAKGDDSHNQPLSARRAQAVAEWLATEGGLARSRLKARGYGETKPVAPNTKADGSDNPAGRAKNRRVVVSTAT
ncbi:OmpA family protein [Nonomuraea sp. SYSU D8015]|uniref:OmpA family protein n=1 Tax=Nonomuraea sp. SYSU D8015 TaxID=2593644 RepID=UPI00166170C5|nr:OmpA family protein [Nonomuraea sp. SYSU D8015]